VSIALLALGVALLALPGALGPVGARLVPREWCRAVVLCLRVGRFALRLALASAALPLVLQAVGAHEIAHACHRSMTAGLPLPPALGWVAMLALGVSVLRSLGTRRRNAAALGHLRVEPWLGDHHVQDGVDVVTLPCAEQVAYAVPGEPDQVVVSQGLLSALDDDEADAVLRHERAHLRHRHHAALTLARDIEAWMGWFPPARSSVATLRLAVERWADEDAGRTAPSGRPAVRRALLKTVVLAIGPVPTFTDACTIAARLDALASSPPSPSIPTRLVATGPVLGLCALVLGALAACAVVAHHGIDGLVGHCPF
jgi:hypothetical protein